MEKEAPSLKPEQMSSYASYWNLVSGPAMSARERAVTGHCWVRWMAPKARLIDAGSIDQHCSPQTLFLVTMCALTSQYENATVTIMRHHRNGGLESSNLFSHNSGGLKSEIKVSGFPRSLSPGLVAGHPLLYLLASSMFFPLYASVFLIFLSIRCQSYWIRAAHITSF